VDENEGSKPRLLGQVRWVHHVGILGSEVSGTTNEKLRDIAKFHPNPSILQPRALQYCPNSVKDEREAVLGLGENQLLHHLLNEY